MVMQRCMQAECVPLGCVYPLHAGLGPAMGGLEMAQAGRAARTKKVRARRNGTVGERVVAVRGGWSGASEAVRILRSLQAPRAPSMAERLRTARWHQS
ncbi:hypothetical protein Thpro_022192 [Acidihalobacter prosperus]|uniref:Uncharacterized protein n=1 Tax=Acidihalobacter prosperus TaxID=160660 RepID=A0A1A6C057_9GAMM|nr:hypothetical protein Thpro_022192 [Acidihalobacter prosperus]